MPTPLRSERRSARLALPAETAGAVRGQQGERRGRPGNQTARPPGHVAALGHGLMAAAPARPRQPKAKVRGVLAPGPQQAADLGRAQGDQLSSSAPFFPAATGAGGASVVAWARVTSR